MSPLVGWWALVVLGSAGPQPKVKQLYRKQIPVRVNRAMLHIVPSQLWEEKHCFFALMRGDIGLYENFEKKRKVQENVGKSTIKRMCRSYLLGGFDWLHVLFRGVFGTLEETVACDIIKVLEMSEISVIGNAVPGDLRGKAPAQQTTPVEVVAPTTDSSEVEAADCVEFSHEARLLEKIQQMPSVRQQRIDTIKNAIADNSYLTNDKLGLAIDRMINELCE